MSLGTKNKAVVISDIHFSVPNLELASAALEDAFQTARNLDIPLIIAGDLQDTKAIIRAEVANRLIQIFDTYHSVDSYVLVGNHDLINEKGSENALNYLEWHARLIKKPKEYFNEDFSFIPYQSSKEEFEKIAKTMTGLLICHQGFLGAFMGDYIQDKSSTSVETVSHLRVFTGHYHRHQTIGTVTYCGSPYTQSWTEANDGSKGYLIIKEDGTFERKILNLRKHIVSEVTVDTLHNVPKYTRPQDLVWVKVRGPKNTDLSKVRNVLVTLLHRKDFKLDLIPDSPIISTEKLTTPKTEQEMLDSIIDASEGSMLKKDRLKDLWRGYYETDINKR